MGLCVQAIAMVGRDQVAVPKTTTPRLRRIRVSWDWFQSLRARERDAFWSEVYAMFGVGAPWQLNSRVEFDLMKQDRLMVERRA